MENTKRVALITGAAGGIGRAIAILLAKDSIVVLLDQNDEVTALADDLETAGRRAVPLVADLADPGQIQRAVADMENAVGPCDILINNAGIHPRPADGRTFGFEDVSLETWEVVLQVNLTAPFLLSQRVLPAMKRKGWGRIVNVASRAGRTYSDRAAAPYSASKAGLIGLTRSIAGEFGPYGVTANCVAPGQTSAGHARKTDPTVLAAAAAAMPTRRLGAAEEIASVIQYLTTDLAGFVNGAVWDVNGGGFMGG